MNDPGVEKPIQDAANELEPIASDDKHGQNSQDADSMLQEKRDYNDPSRWWFASTGCPLIAGTLGPLASTFSICALVSPWRYFVPTGVPADQGTDISDPHWLVAINALSLVCAVVANSLLLLTMAERVRFKIAQPICITGFFLASILLIVDLAALTSSPTYRIPLDSPAAPDNMHALTSAFYYAIQAAVLYLFVASLMCLTAYGAFKGHYEAQFRLTPAQRTLMLQTMAFFAYLLLGALIYSHIEGWRYLNAVYWANLTLLTIGLGSDFHPTTHAGRSLLFFFAIGGIIVIGLVIGSIRTLVLENGKRKLSARMMEKKRRRAINSVDPRKHRIQISRFQTMKFNNADLDPARRRQLEFTVMRAVQEGAERDRRWMALGVSTVAALCLWLLGALVFSKTEFQQQWSYFESLYFAYVCLVTIGYGDFYPESNSGRAFFVLWTLLAVPTLTILISDMSDTVVAAFSSLILKVGNYTVLPGDAGVLSNLKSLWKHVITGELQAIKHKKQSPRIATPGGVLGETRGGDQSGEASGEQDQFSTNVM